MLPQEQGLICARARGEEFRGAASNYGYNQSVLSIGVSEIPQFAPQKIDRIGSVQRDTSGQSHEQESRKTILLFDKARLTRDCFTTLLRSSLPEFDVLSSSQAEATGAFPTSHPAAVLINIHHRDLGDSELKQEIATIRGATDAAPVLLLSYSLGSDVARQAAGAGLAGVFPSNCSVPLLIAAIRLVVAGGEFYAPNYNLQQRSSSKENGATRRSDHGDYPT